MKKLKDSIVFFIVFSITFSLSTQVQVQAQTFILPTIGYGQMNFKNWNPESGLDINQYKYSVVTYGVGVEQSFNENFKSIFTTRYSSKIKLKPIYNIGFTAGIDGEEWHFNLLENEISFYYRILSKVSLGLGMDRVSMRNFKWPSAIGSSNLEELESIRLTYWGYHLGFNYEQNNLGCSLEYHQIQYPNEFMPEKIPYWSFSVYYKFQVLNKIGFSKRKGKRSKKRKTDCPTF